MSEESRWCGPFDCLWGAGTTVGLHYCCRRCGRIYQWSGFTSIKVGPCVEPPIPGWVGEGGYEP